MKKRTARVTRTTKETNIDVRLAIDGKGFYKITTGIPFLDHMLSLFTKHGVFDLFVCARGDLEIDIHHTNEDLGIVLGEAFAKALSDKTALTRFGIGYAVLDEAMVRVVTDISGRPYLACEMPKKKITEEGYSLNYFQQFLRGFTNSSRMTLHIDVLKGEDFHHIIEACFKALAVSLHMAVSKDPRKKGLPTTKGTL